jgi:hypothetical protein
MALLDKDQMAFPGLALLIAYSFPQQTFHVPGISSFLGSWLHLWICHWKASLLASIQFANNESRVLRKRK